MLHQKRARGQDYILLVVILVLIATWGCSGGLKKLKGEDKIFVDPGFWEQAEAMFGEFGGGIWLKEKTTMIRFEGGNWYVSEDHHYQIVVLDSKKMEKYANVEIRFGPTSKIIMLKARTIKSTGEVIPVEGKDIYEKSSVPGFMLYADIKSKVFAMPGFTDRCVIDYTYRIEDQALYLADEFFFGSSLPVRKARYAYGLDADLIRAGVQVVYRPHNVDVEPVNQRFDTYLGTVAMWQWEMENIEAFPEEPWMPPKERFVPHIRLAGFAPGEDIGDWNNFARWYDRMVPWLKSRIGEIEQIVNETVGDVEDPQEIVQRVVDFVGGNIRYVSVGLEDAGFEPHHPVNVLKNRYGDCKDMAYLAIAMLRHKGIEAYPALVLTRHEGVIDRSLVIPRFNHMIVYVVTDEGEIWIDPTAGQCPVGYLPDMDRDVDALVLLGTKGVWKHTPAVPPIPSRKTSLIALKVQPTGEVSGTTQIRLMGDDAFHACRKFEASTRSDLDRAVKSEVGYYFTGADLDSCWLIDTDRRHLCATVAARFRKTKAATAIEDRLILSLDFVATSAFRLGESLAGSSRKFPFWLTSGWEEADTIVVEIPEGWRLEKVSPAEYKDSRYGSFGFQAIPRADKVIAVMETKVKAGEVWPDEFDDLIKFWTEARNAQHVQLILKKI